MDLLEKWLRKEKRSKLIKRALTDKSCKEACIDGYTCRKKINNDLATYGDAIIKVCLIDILFDKVEKLSEEKSKYECDKYLVKYVAKHYDILKYIHKDKENEYMPNDYKYEKYQSKNHNKNKYLATCIEALIGAIYLETHRIKPITKLIKSWMEFKNEK